MLSTTMQRIKHRWLSTILIKIKEYCNKNNDPSKDGCKLSITEVNILSNRKNQTVIKKPKSRHNKISQQNKNAKSK